MAEDMEPAARAAQRAVVTFPEHVGASAAAQASEQLLAALDCGAELVIADMSATAWCDGACLDAVTRACQRAAVCRAELRLVASAPEVRQLLAASGLDRLVPMYLSLEAASTAGKSDAAASDEDYAPPGVAAGWPPRLTAESGPASVNQALVLRQLIDALADGIVLAAEDGRIALANRRAAAMFGYRPGELDGQGVESLLPAGLREGHQLDRAAYACRPAARPMADRARLVGLRKDGTTVPVTITLSPVPTADRHFTLAVVRDASHERWRDDLTGLVHAVLAEQAQHAEELLDRVVGNLFHVGVSLDQAASQPAEQARERISGALQRLDDTIHEIRGHVFRSRRPGGTAW
jgi:PAS domain S-box-containing protein